MRTYRYGPLVVGVFILMIVAGGPEVTRAQSNWTVIGWNNLGMHCMDSDYSVFSILPPYNTIHAQVIDSSGRLVTNPVGIGVSYHAISDLDGSINRTSRGKGNFWQYASSFFGVSLPADTGLPVPGPEMFTMPGTNNTPQAMKFESAMKWFAAYGVPISPYDDAGKPNQYPMMRLMVTNGSGHVLAMTDIVLPVSDEMDCKLCHASGSGPAAEPLSGWVWDPDPGRDYRLNILRLHDQFGFSNTAYAAALATNGFNAAGLFATAVTDKHPILCASCHLSEALPGSGLPGIPPLTEAMHGRHSGVDDPRNGMTLGMSDNRQACYSCHPGSETRCLRGAMGSAVAADGSMLMQCQSCHGGMDDVGSPLRTGWLDEPNCQACHVGSATNSFGVIRFSDAMTTNGQLRVPNERLFATSADTPMPDISLYRFSSGHGGLQCSACHGSTHAIFPTALPSDNIANIQMQGHAGTINECTSCHRTMPNTRTGGPHGMHRIGQAWIDDHNNAAQQLGRGVCRVCHGQNGEGSVLSLTFSAKTITSERGTINYWKGQKVTCFGCHNGMNTGDPTTRGVPVVTNVSAVTTSGIPVAIALNGANLRIVDKPAFGQVALAGAIATYFPDSAYAGPDSFTFAANNGYNDSNLGRADVSVRPDPAGLPAPEPARVFTLSVTGGHHMAVATQLGDSYVVQSTVDIEHPDWSNETGVVRGHTDVTTITTPPDFTETRFIRVVAVDDPGPAIMASDDASDPAYAGGWGNGSNGGAGFAAWSLVTKGASAGFFIAETNAAFRNLQGKAWGLWASAGSTAEARRVCSAPLAVGDAVSFGFENNLVNTGGRVGVDFLNASGGLLARLLFIGGQSVYRVEDRAGSRVTFAPWTDQGRQITFRVASDGEYLLSIGSYHVPGLMINLPDRSVAAIQFWNGNAGSGSDHDLFISELVVERP